MPYKIYIQFDQEDVFIAHDENPEIGNTLFAQGFCFVPQAIFRERIDSSVEYEVDLDPYEYKKLHVVVVHWFEFFGEEDDRPVYKWAIQGIYPSRREALEAKLQIELGDMGIGEWAEENTMIEEVAVFSLDVED